MRVSTVSQQASHRYSCRLFIVPGQPQEKAKSSRARTSYTPLFGLTEHARDA